MTFDLEFGCSCFLLQKISLTHFFKIHILYVQNNHKVRKLGIHFFFLSVCGGVEGKWVWEGGWGVGGFEWVFVEAGLGCLLGSGGVCECGCGGREGTVEYVCLCACVHVHAEGVMWVWVCRVVPG